MKMVHGFENEFQFLSNFSAVDVLYNGHIYKTAEHAFQAAKATNERDRAYIEAAPTPGQAKRRGRGIELREDWETVKDQVMLDIVRAKFRNSDCRHRLMKALTDGWDGFCEDNWWHDNYWGDCKCPACADKFGQNKLGKILMQVTNEIVSELKEGKNLVDES